jgi:hypothetical protein
LRRWWFRAASSWREPLLKAEDAPRAAGGSRSAVVVATGLSCSEGSPRRAAMLAQPFWLMCTSFWSALLCCTIGAFAPTSISSEAVPRNGHQMILIASVAGVHSSPFTSERVGTARVSTWRCSPQRRSGAMSTVPLIAARRSRPGAQVGGNGVRRVHDFLVRSRVGVAKRSRGTRIRRLRGIISGRPRRRGHA